MILKAPEMLNLIKKTTLLHSYKPPTPTPTSQFLSVSFTSLSKIKNLTFNTRNKATIKNPSFTHPGADPTIDTGHTTWHFQLDDVPQEVPEIPPPLGPNPDPVPEFPEPPLGPPPPLGPEIPSPPVGPPPPLGPEIPLPPVGPPPNQPPEVVPPRTPDVIPPPPSGPPEFLPPIGPFVA